MDKLTGMLAFVKTADLGSFAAAGRALEISASAVGKSVTRLEDELGVRLLQRSTRSIRLTAEGLQFHERCRRILDELEDAHALLSHASEAPRGRLRVSAPIVGHHFLLPVIPDFVARYPDIELDIHFTDRSVDLIEEGIDVAIRSGQPPDSRLVSRPLQAFRLLLCASPDYLARHGEPASLADLPTHSAVRFRHPNTGKLLDWPMLDDTQVHPKTVLAFNNMEAVFGACVRGLGIACMPDFLASQALAEHGLRIVLERQAFVDGQFRAIWNTNRHLAPKARVFIDHLSERLRATTAGTPVAGP